MNLTEINITMTLVEDLLPFSTYSVIVFAVSERGTGPASEAQTTITAEDGEFSRCNGTVGGSGLGGACVHIKAFWTHAMSTSKTVNGCWVGLI